MRVPRRGGLTSTGLLSYRPGEPQVDITVSVYLRVRVPAARPTTATRLVTTVTTTGLST